SPLAQEILSARPYAFLDDAPLEERRTQAVMSRRWLDPATASDLGTLDQSAIDRVRDEAWPDVANPDELHDALMQLGFVTDLEGVSGRPRWDVAASPAGESEPENSDCWEGYLQNLIGENRATRLRIREAGPVLWVAAERLPHLKAILPTATMVTAINAPDWVRGDLGGVEAPHRGDAENSEVAQRVGPEVAQGIETGDGRTSGGLSCQGVGSTGTDVPSAEESLVEVLRGRMEAIGPVTPVEVAESLGLPVAHIERALISLEAEGFVMRGRFTPGVSETEWCVRRLLSRIHGYTLNRLRKEIEPVSAADFIRFLLDWQGVSPDHQAEGPESLAALIEQLDGFEAPAAAWEGEILTARLVEYEPEWLDSLCLSGRVAWARLTPPKPATEKGRGAGPIKNTPVSLMTRRNLPAWNSFAAQADLTGGGLSVAAGQVFEHLTSRGASFFHDLTEGTRLLRSQVEDGLAELVAYGLVTADSFTGLRALLVPSSKRTASGTKRRGAGTIFNMEHAGRWSRLQRQPQADPEPVAAGPRRLPAAARLSDIAADQIERIARTFLRRYGVVSRRVLDREGITTPWRELLRVYHRLEARGEIRGGRFIAGLSGEQFALPEAVGMLRTIRRGAKTGQLVSVSGADPLNMAGIITPGSRITSLSSNRVLYRDGEPIATLEGGNVNFLVELSAAAQWEAKNALVRRRVAPELRAYLGQSA
ncbi:MAG TPA: hypothetical protein VI756_05485, partial [Blastocatellia bacterium]